METVGITRRMVELARWIPYAQVGRYDLIDPADRVEMVCQQVEMRSEFEKQYGEVVRLLQLEEQILAEAGFIFRHPQLGVLLEEDMEDLKRWLDKFWTLRG